jgi:hypothetical protein
MDPARPRLTGVATLALPFPELLPSHPEQLTAALSAAGLSRSSLAVLGTPADRAALRRRLAGHVVRSPMPSPAAGRPGGSVPTARRRTLEEYQEHDRYFDVTRTGGGPDGSAEFVTGLVLAHVTAVDDAHRMGVTILDDTDWVTLFGGLATLLRRHAPPAADDGVPTLPNHEAPARPAVAAWTDDYDPARRWLVGHQLFFALIQGAIVGINIFAAAANDPTIDGDAGLTLAAAFLRASAASMKLTSDFAPDDYDTSVRPAMAPPAVREGFSGLQTRDHAYLIRLFSTVKAALAARSVGPSAAHAEFVESVVDAYAAHEFICARFRGDVLPSLRMAAATRGSSDRSGVSVIRDMMRTRLALVDPHGVAAPLAPSPATE